MSKKNSKGCLVATLLWCVILVILAVAYKFLVHPYFSQKLTEETGSSSRYEHEVTLAADSFSGYAVLRSSQMRQWLSDKQIKWQVKDDGANYEKRISQLKSQKVQMAVFTIDSYLKAGADLGEFPGSIVTVLDETKGGDAMVAHEEAFESVQELSHSETQIVLTPHSPSEFLARVILAHFNLPDLREDWLEPSEGSAEVLKQLQRTNPREKKAFVLWQPHVAQALESGNVKVLLDSSQLKGFIVDVLVVEREFLKKFPEVVETVVEGYFRTLYSYQNKKNGVETLVSEDAQEMGMQTLNSTLASAVVEGIHWKNTMDNYWHFGLEQGNTANAATHLEDMISNIMDVLLKTGSISQDPLRGQHHTLFFDQVLRKLKTSQFHPGKELNLIQGVGNNDIQTATITSKANALSEAQWDSLIPVGELKVDAITFVRGSSNMSSQSKREVDQLAKRLAAFPNFYLKLIGQTRAEGNVDANQRLAEQRAKAVSQRLTEQGVEIERIHTEAAPSNQRGGAAQSVVFQVGQLPY